MADVLYLVHRLPYPPNKGDKVRSFHLLTHLSARHRVHLGTFVDDPADLRHVDTLRSWCASMHVEPMSPRAARVRSMRGLLTGEALTLPYYRNARLAAWVERTVREHRPAAAIAFSSAMAQYLPPSPDMARLVDLVDVDSAKWTQYADSHAWPLSWLYRREGRKLLEFERAAVESATRAFLVTDAEVELFRALAPASAGAVEAMGNGVDADFFNPDRSFASPFASAEVPIVFTGAMDYLPNVDAARWFASSVVPGLAAVVPGIRFYVVGMRPTAEVAALAGDRVVVTGTVPDVRPYLAHARVVVAPLRIARGVQNKVLEAMAMGRPVVVSSACASGIEATPGADFAVASDAPEFVERILALLSKPASAEAMGRAARECVASRYSWNARLANIDGYIDAPNGCTPVGAAGGRDVAPGVACRTGVPA